MTTKRVRIILGVLDRMRNLPNSIESQCAKMATLVNITSIRTYPSPDGFNFCAEVQWEQNSMLDPAEYEAIDAVVEAAIQGLHATMQMEKDGHGEDGLFEREVKQVNSAIEALTRMDLMSYDTAIKHQGEINTIKSLR